MNCQEFEEISGAYVLDAVTPEERKLAEEHIAQCPHCTQLIQEFQLAVSALPLSVPIVEPSAALKERILTSIRSNTATTSQPDVATIPQPMRRIERAKVNPRRRTRWQRWSTRLLVVAALIMLVLFSAMAAWNIVLQQQISSLTASSASVSYPLRSASTGSEAKGSLTCFPKQQLCVLAVRELPPLEGTQVYQGWLLQGKQPTSIGILNVRNGVATADVQGSVGNYDVAAVSVEPGPAASKDAPRGKIIAIGKVSGSASNA